MTVRRLLLPRLLARVLRQLTKTQASLSTELLGDIKDEWDLIESADTTLEKWLDRVAEHGAVTVTAAKDLGDNLGRGQFRKRVEHDEADSKAKTCFRM